MSNRILKGVSTGEYKGQGSAYIIPADDMPVGLSSGKRYKFIIQGPLQIDDQGGVIMVERIYAEELDSREDPIQKQIEEGLNTQVNAKM